MKMNPFRKTETQDELGNRTVVHKLDVDAEDVMGLTLTFFVATAMLVGAVAAITAIRHRIGTCQEEIRVVGSGTLDSSYVSCDAGATIEIQKRDDGKQIAICRCGVTK